MEVSHLSIEANVEMNHKRMDGGTGVFLPIHDCRAVSLVDIKILFFPSHSLLKLYFREGNDKIIVRVN